MAGVFVLWACAIDARLVYLHVIQHDELVARAGPQQLATIEAPAKRGEILDRKGRVHAYSIDADSIYAVPSKIDDDASTAAAVCEALRDCTAKDRATLAERFATSRPSVVVRRKVAPDQAK